MGDSYTISTPIPGAIANIIRMFMRHTFNLI